MIREEERVLDKVCRTDRCSTPEASHCDPTVSLDLLAKFGVGARYGDQRIGENPYSTLKDRSWHSARSLSD